jgi:hypothetical protein
MAFLILYLECGLVAEDLCLEGLVFAQQQVDGGEIVPDISLHMSAHRQVSSEEHKRKQELAKTDKVFQRMPIIQRYSI